MRNFGKGKLRLVSPARGGACATRTWHKRLACGLGACRVRYWRRARAGRHLGSCGWVGAVQERKRRTGTNELGVAGNTREIEQGLGDVRSQRVSACVRTAVANACTTVPLMLAPHCSHLCNNDKRVVRKGPMDGVNVQWLPGPLGERARDCMCLHCYYQCLYHCTAGACTTAATCATTERVFRRLQWMV